MKTYTIKFYDLNESDYENNNFGEKETEEFGEGYTISDFYADRAGISLDEIESGFYAYETDDGEKRYVVIA